MTRLSNSSARQWLVAGVIASLASGLCAAPAAHAQLGDDALDPQRREEAFAELEREYELLERQRRVIKAVARLIGPTVVHIETSKTDAFGARFGSRRMIEEAGSGVIIERDNRMFVLTNWHVIRDARTDRITIRLHDGRQLKPKRDPWKDAATDVAVLEIEGQNLVPAKLGNSDALEIGDFVLAVGSPFGLDHSVTYGIISAKGRRDLELGDAAVRFQNFLQTDAAINPGNSGGPLINLRGRVVGINTAIASNSGGNEGIGFSIPINMVMKIADQLIDRGNVVRAYLGVTWDLEFGPADAAKAGLPAPMGARVSAITAGSPAEAADLRVGDVILQFDGVRIEDGAHLQNVVSLTDVGRSVRVVIFRDRQQSQLEVTVGDRRDFDRSSMVEPPRSKNGPVELGLNSLEAWEVESLGLTIVVLDDSVAGRLGAAQRKRGLLVTAVAKHGPTSGLLRPGDIVVAIDGEPSRQIEDLERIMGQANLAVGLSLDIASLRGGKQRVSRVQVTPRLAAKP